MAKINVCYKKIYLLIPDTFMNLSGVSVIAVSNFYNIKLDEILVVHDELDLKIGHINFKFGCGHNGHNGIRNIISVFGKNINFLRIQIGIGRPNKLFKISEFVLSVPTVFEKSIIQKSILHAINIFYKSISVH